MSCTAQEETRKPRRAQCKKSSRTTCEKIGSGGGEHDIRRIWKAGLLYVGSVARLHRPTETLPQELLGSDVQLPPQRGAHTSLFSQARIQQRLKCAWGCIYIAWNCVASFRLLARSLFAISIKTTDQAYHVLDIIYWVSSQNEHMHTYMNTLARLIITSRQYDGLLEAS